MFLDINVSVIIAAAIILAALITAHFSRYRASRRITILLAGIFLSSFFLFLPCYLELSREGVATDGHPYPPEVRSIVYTLYYSLRALSGGHEVDVMEELTFISSAPKLIRGIYFALNYGYFVAAPLLTSSLILSLIGDLWDRLRCRLGWYRKYHIFSELNRTSLSLAKTVHSKSPKERIVFCKTKKADAELVSQARSLGAILLYASCETAKIPTNNRNLLFYSVFASEDENLNCTEALIRKFREKKNCTVAINAFAESSTGIQVVESLDKGTVGVRFIDETELLCSQLLLRYPLDRLPENQKTVSLAIIGCDKTGMHMLKTAAWCAQVNGLHLKIRVFDQKASYLKNKLQAQCPELPDHCDLTFVNIDAKTAELESSMMANCSEATYIVTAMGDDELNIAVAERLYRLFRHHNRYRWTPQILVRIRNSTKSDVYGGKDTPYLAQRNIHIFGNMEDMFPETALFHSYLDHLSFAVHLCYCNLLPKEDPSCMSLQQLRDYFSCDDVRHVRSQFLQSEYDRRSSMAAALHIPVKLRSCGVLTSQEQILSEETIQKFREALEAKPDLLEALAQNEHQRWNQFMRTEGYVRASWEDLLDFYPIQKDNKDVLSKRHLCLTDWQDLAELNCKYLALNPPKAKDFKESDYSFIRQIPYIILLAKRMEEVPPED